MNLTQEQIVKLIADAFRVGRAEGMEIGHKDGYENGLRDGDAEGYERGLERTICSSLISDAFQELIEAAVAAERESIAQMFEGGYEHILRDNVAHEIRARGEA